VAFCPITLHPGLARLAAAVVATILLELAPRAALAQSAASFIAAISAVQGIDAAGQTRRAERGGVLAPGDRVVTGSNGLAQIRFSDGAMLSVRADSDLKIDAYSFRGERDTLATTVLQLVRGGLRAIAGAVARIRRRGYKVVTPTAAIGVRGTDFEAFHIPPPSQGGVALPDEPGTICVSAAAWRSCRPRRASWTSSRNRWASSRSPRSRRDCFARDRSSCCRRRDLRPALLPRPDRSLRNAARAGPASRTCARRSRAVFSRSVRAEH
jgi:FecR protein